MLLFSFVDEYMFLADAKCLVAYSYPSNFISSLNNCSFSKIRNSDYGVNKQKMKNKEMKISHFGLEPFDVAIDFPFSDLRAVKVPFSAFFNKEICERCFTKGFTH